VLQQGLKEMLADQLRRKKAVVIVVDVQNDFCHKEGAFSKLDRDLSTIQEQVIPRLVSFLETCRRQDLPIVFVRTIHSDWTNSPTWLTRGEGMAKRTPICSPESWGAEFYEVQPEAKDCVVTKHRYSGFSGTDLDLILRSRGFETIVMTGVVTNVCVETTARDGFNLNYNVVFVEDCCGACYPDEHAATLKNISKYFGVVTDSKSLMDLFER